MHEAPSITQTPTPKDPKKAPKNATSRHVYSETTTRQTPTKNASAMKLIINPSDASPKLGPQIEFGERWCALGPNSPKPLPIHATASGQTAIKSDKNDHKHTESSTISSNSNA
jgi:hypothetical protein